MKTSPTIILLLDIKISVAQLYFFVCFFYRAVIKGLPPPPLQPQEKKEIRTLAV